MREWATPTWATPEQVGEAFESGTPPPHAEASAATSAAAAAEAAAAASPCMQGEAEVGDGDNADDVEMEEEEEEEAAAAAEEEEAQEEEEVEAKEEEEEVVLLTEAVQSHMPLDTKQPAMESEEQRHDLVALFSQLKAERREQTVHMHGWGALYKLRGIRVQHTQPGDVKMWDPQGNVFRSMVSLRRRLGLPDLDTPMKVEHSAPAASGAAASGAAASNTHAKRASAAAATSCPTSAAAHRGAGRAPSAYNLFMQAEIHKVKADAPGLTHKEAFTEAARRWSSHRDGQLRPADKTRLACGEEQQQEEESEEEESEVVEVAEAASELVTEAEGLQLRMSSKNGSGYVGVVNKGTRFEAIDQSGGKCRVLGAYATAVEAAVAYAKNLMEIQQFGNLHSGVLDQTARQFENGSEREAGLSAYNMFMRDEIARLRQEQPVLDHQERFKIAASRWKTSPLNRKAAAVARLHEATPSAAAAAALAIPPQLGPSPIPRSDEAPVVTEGAMPIVVQQPAVLLEPWVAARLSLVTDVREEGACSVRLDLGFRPFVDVSRLDRRLDVLRSPDGSGFWHIRYEDYTHGGGPGSRRGKYWVVDLVGTTEVLPSYKRSLASALFELMRRLSNGNSALRFQLFKSDPAAREAIALELQRAPFEDARMQCDAAYRAYAAACMRHPSRSRRQRDGRA